MESPRPYEQKRLTNSVLQVGYTQANFYSRALLEMIYIRNVAFVTAVSMKWVL